MKVIDISGKQFGRLYVKAFSHVKDRRSYWVCECECGKTVILRKDHFAYPYSKQKSCGCLHRENSSARMKEYHEKARRRNDVPL